MTKRLTRGTTIEPDPVKLFHSIEHAVLATYLSRRDLLPAGARELDPRSTVDPDTWDEAANGIAPLDGAEFAEDLVVENAVARIALQAIQDRLPQWAAASRGGKVQFGREVRQKADLPGRTDVTVPLFLFEINWADSGPGFSWPEAYYLTWIPYYDSFVVTASNDCTDVHGFTDYAIGHFREGSIDNEVKAIVTGQWRKLTTYNQPRWAYLFGAGAVEAETAEAWADEVWDEDGEPLKG